MSGWLIALGVVSLALALVHVLGGGKECARPLLGAELDRIAKLTLYACWHYVSLHLALGGAALVWIGLSPTPVGRAVAAVIAATWLGFAAVFLAIIPRAGVEGAWFRLGQWMAFLPMGLVGLVASLG